MSRHTRRRWSTVTGALALALLVSSPAAADTVDPVAPPPEVFLDTDAKAVLDWSVPARYDASWAAYTASDGSYDPDFVNPITWSMTLDGCASTSVYKVTSYSFTLSQVGTAWTRSVSTTSCRPTVAGLPAQGYYKASLVLRTDMGLSPGVSRPAVRNVQLRDHLIVSMGDSLASGEGSPDSAGSYGFTIDSGLNPKVTVRRAVQWKDRRCHRSARSGPALAAKAFEDASKYSSITFISVACSGAEVQHLVGSRYGGIQPSGTFTFPPQIDAVSELVGPSAPRGGRQIDALLIAAGVNNLDFSDILKRCVLNNNFSSDNEDCVREGGLADKIEDLRREYAYLALGLFAKLPSTSEVYLNDYPANLFNDGACGLLAGVLPSRGIDRYEGQEMDYQGRLLAKQIRRATDDYRLDPHRWNFVGPLATPFASHKYCDSTPWFTTLEQSLSRQGNVEGTAHPNPAGHAAYGVMLKRAMVLDQGSTPYRRVTLTLDAVKAAPGGSVPLRVDPRHWRYQNDPTGQTRPFSVPRNGQWTPVPAAVGVFKIDMHVAPASPRHAVQLEVVLNNVLPIRHTRVDGFGAGAHELRHPTGSVAVRYHVDVVPGGPPGNA